MQSGAKPTIAPVGHRRCHMCQHIKPLDNFTRHKSKPQGRGYACVACSRTRSQKWRKENPQAHREDVMRWRKNNPHKVTQYARNWRKNNPEKASAASLWSNQGITQETYNQMHAAQKGLCAVCHTDKPGGRAKRLVVDHCHTTSVIRGLLCHSCNSALGLFRDDPVRLAAAIRYLTERG